MIHICRDPNDPDPYKLLPELQKIGVLREGHFVLKQPVEARNHSGHYFDKTVIWTHPSVAELVFKAIFNEIIKNVPNVEVVAGPALGAIIPAFATATILNRNLSHRVRNVWVEKDDDGKFFVPRLYAEIVKGAQVVVVEDVTTKVESVTGAVSALKEACADVRGVVLVCNRSGKTDAEIAKKLQVPWVKSLVKLDLPVFTPDQCPFCHDIIQSRPINLQLGYGKEFVEAHPDIAALCGTRS